MGNTATPQLAGQVSAEPPSALPATVAPKPDDLSPEELRARLALHSPLLVEELHQTALRQVANETGRQGRLDGKATSLLTATGLSLTVAFTFGGQFLFNNAEKLKVSGEDRWRIVIGAFCCAVGSGLLAGLYAMRALRVSTDYGALDERTVFNERELREANNADAECGDDSEAASRAREQGLARYRRYVTIELWQLVQRHQRIHERKGKIIFRGQVLFMVFIASLLFICVSIVTSL